MIYLISDLHNDFEHAGLKAYLKTPGNHDLLLILGDVGLNFPEIDGYKDFEEKFLNISKPVAFLDGNHENHAYLQSFPVETWCGGKVHRLTDNIVHLMRGYTYTIDGKTFFVMGGCKSSESWYLRGLASPEDKPSAEEIARGYTNLSLCGNRVDYVLTHKYKKVEEPASDKNTLEALQDYIDDHVEYNVWYCGHWHNTFKIDEKHFIVYDKLIPIP